MELFLILVCLIAPPALSLSIKSKLNPRIVQTRYGEVQGITRSFEYAKFLKPIDVYLGIPYATPPVGTNRFSPTRAPSPWEGVRLSDSVGPVCPQKLPDIANEQEALERMPKGRLEYLKRLLPHLRNQSEDCLYLNIYAPAMANKLFLRVDIHNESNPSTLWKKRNFRCALADEVILTGRRASNVGAEIYEWLRVNGRAGNAGKA
ncbi:Neuroligin-4, Y-linked [Atta colombica]|uniref:Neuroligin-4, Y-linked n=1 Tax=Atta colombica TaxID=520822 RepID=A0A195AZZ9_9HYME|nr:Neuroligin-4, Y-linked [Atta colombica]